MRNKSIAICVGIALVLMGAFVVSAQDEVSVEVEMEVMPDMFVLSANSPWMELDVYDYEVEGYLSFADLYLDTELAEELKLEVESVEIINKNNEVSETFTFSGDEAYDRFEIKLSETTLKPVLAIMIDREFLKLDSGSVDPEDSLFEGRELEFVATGTITYPDGSSVKFTATDSEVWVKLQGEMPEKAGGNGGKR